MPNSKDFTTTERYRDGIRQTLRAVLDFLSLVGALVVALNIFRAHQFGTTFIVTTTLMFMMGVLPSILIRSDRFLLVRGGLILFGFMITNLIGIASLGLGAAAIVAFPFHVALCAALFGRNAALLVFSALVLALGTLAFLFVQGRLVSPDIPLSTWNSSAGNWMVMIISLAVTCLLIIALAHNLSRSWQETDADAANRIRQIEALVDYAPDAITILDARSVQFVAVNPRAAELFGIARERLLAGPVLDDLNPERQPSGERSSDLARKYIAEALAGGNPTFEWTHLRGDGTEVPCEVSLCRLPSDDGELVRGNIIDISQRKADERQREALQIQLAAAQRLESIGQLTGGIAHDFNNLLAVILGNLELLQEDCENDAQKERLQPCIDATLRGADLTRSMLSYARQASLRPEIFDLNKLVQDTKNWTGRTLPTRIEINTSLQSDLWTVEADPGMSESALVNLILNARDAMPDGGKLTIETSNIRIDHGYIDSRNEVLKPGRYVMVAVSDTGTGIKKENFERIFDPFFTTKAPGMGSGLGLPMVLGYMRQSGGTVQVYSEPGTGTTFKLFFPAVEGGQTERDGDRIEPAKPTEKGKRVLIVEDEAEVLKVLVSMLEAAGYSVLAAASGDAARSIFEVEPAIDLLLTDIVMPGRLQGTDLARELRAIDEKLPVVFMSGYASEATVHGNGLRPDDVRLMKPVMRRDLLAAVLKALNRPGT